MFWPNTHTSADIKETINLTKSRGCSSLYKPNLKYLKNYPDVERFFVEDTVTVETTSLDTLYNDKVFSNIDFIKIDTQGSELDILKGGEKFLSKNLLKEVRFSPD